MSDDKIVQVTWLRLRRLVKKHYPNAVTTEIDQRTNEIFDEINKAVDDAIEKVAKKADT